MPDSQGQRLTKELSDGTIYTYHYFNGDVLYETKSTETNDNILHALYIRSPQGKPLAVSMDYDISNPEANSWYYYHYNAHGDVIAVTDENGDIFREYVYDPYGNILSVRDGAGALITDLEADSFNHAYTYAGYRFDSETGLYYLNARYYEAGIGRFLTKDKRIGDIYSTLCFNRYAYTLGDPINYIDPSGESEVAIPWNWIWTEIEGGVSTAISIISGALGAVGGAILIILLNPTPTADASVDMIQPLDSSTAALTNNVIESSRSKNKLQPDPSAEGDHTTYKRNPKTGKILVQDLFRG